MDDEDGGEDVLNLEDLCEAVVPLFLAGFVRFLFLHRSWQIKHIK